jgi:hypothetical protein
VVEQLSIMVARRPMGELIMAMHVDSVIDCLKV